MGKDEQCSTTDGVTKLTKDCKCGNNSCPKNNYCGKGDWCLPKSLSDIICDWSDPSLPLCYQNKKHRQITRIKNSLTNVFRNDGGKKPNKDAIFQISGPKQVLQKGSSNGRFILAEKPCTETTSSDDDNKWKHINKLKPQVISKSDDDNYTIGLNLGTRTCWQDSYCRSWQLGFWISFVLLLIFWICLGLNMPEFLMLMGASNLAGGIKKRNESFKDAGVNIKEVEKMLKNDHGILQDALKKWSLKNLSLKKLRKQFKDSNIGGKFQSFLQKENKETQHGENKVLEKAEITQQGGMAMDLAKPLLKEVAPMLPGVQKVASATYHTIIAVQIILLIVVVVCLIGFAYNVRHQHRPCDATVCAAAKKSYANDVSIGTYNVCFSRNPHTEPYSFMVGRLEVNAVPKQKKSKQ